VKWFKRHNNNDVTDKAARGIAGGILKLQNAFASYSRRYSATWGKKQQLLFLAAVSVLFSVLSVVAIVSPFSKEEKVKKPVVIKLPATIATDVEPRITKEEFERIQQFKRSLDSNTIKGRPGLMDSIHMVEVLYYSNLK
jgi:hypothetical protein